MHWRWTWRTRDKKAGGIRTRAVWQLPHPRHTHLCRPTPDAAPGARPPPLAVSCRLEQAEAAARMQAEAVQMAAIHGELLQLQAQAALEAVLQLNSSQAVQPSSHQRLICADVSTHDAAHCLLHLRLNCRLAVSCRQAGGSAGSAALLLLQAEAASWR